MFDVTVPAFVFGSLISLLIGSFVHLVAGGKLLRFIFCLIFSWIGFWVGNYLAVKMNIEIIKYGQVNYGGAIFLSLLFSIFGFWVSGENKPERE